MSGIAEIVESQKRFFNTDVTKTVAFRLDALKRFEAAIRANEDKILDALYEDLGKSKAEGYMSELAMVYGELHEAIKHVKSWARPKRARGVLGTFPARNVLYSEPYGSVLIMAPWNYPFNLSMAPLVGALAAGNCAVLKCSKSSIHTSTVIQELINSTFDPEYVYCAAPDADYDEVLRQKYDYIFFTGSPRVGKTIMAAAAENLTPVSLELGGKSPCIIDETANLEYAARRVAWGKFLNAGQTCISVDYVVVHRSIKQAFVEALQAEIALRYPDAVNNDNYPKIINQRHFERLVGLMGTEEEVLGGATNEAARKIEPTLLPGATFDSEIMKDEIFGPLLPIIEYEDLDEVVHTIKEREKPLACYIFTSKKAVADKLINTLSFGGGCVNDTILHISNHNLPFGGVGNSGMGGYHGKYSFETFSHKKGVVKSKTVLDVPLRYAPFDAEKFKLLKRFL